MTKTEVESVLTTRTKHGIQWQSSFDGRYYEVSLERGPNLSFHFAEEGLYAVRASETVAPMKVFLHPRDNLCTGEKTIQVEVLAAGDAWTDSAVLIDGRAIGEPGLELELGLGKHQIRLESSHGSSRTADLVLTSESSAVTVTFDEEGHSNVTRRPTTMWWRPHGL
jgi:hypothetical protein